MEPKKDIEIFNMY